MEKAELIKVVSEIIDAIDNEKAELQFCLDIYQSRIEKKIFPLKSSEEEYSHKKCFFEGQISIMNWITWKLIIAKNNELKLTKKEKQRMRELKTIKKYVNSVLDARYEDIHKNNV